MAIEFHCSRCSRQVRAPDEAGGKRGKCPYCGESVYVPLPASMVEEIPLAPVDSELEKREAQLHAEMTRTMAALDKEQKAPPEGAGHGSPETAAALPVGEREFGVEDIVAFVQAMQSSRLDEAERIAAEMKKDRKVRQQVQRLLMDDMPPPGLERVPPPLVKGFLKNLLQRL